MATSFIPGAALIMTAVIILLIAAGVLCSVYVVRSITSRLAEIDQVAKNRKRPGTRTRKSVTAPGTNWEPLESTLTVSSARDYVNYIDEISRF